MRWLRPSPGAVVGLLLLGTCAYVLKQSGNGSGSGSTTAARVEPRTKPANVAPPSRPLSGPIKHVRIVDLFATKPDATGRSFRHDDVHESIVESRDESADIPSMSGEVVEIRGPAMSADLTPRSITIEGLDAKKMLNGLVTCTPPTGAAALKVADDTAVTARGRVGQFLAKFNVQLNDCELIELPRDAGKK